jgi:hypothetical protein
MERGATAVHRCSCDAHGEEIGILRLDREQDKIRGARLDRAQRVAGRCTKIRVGDDPTTCRELRHGDLDGLHPETVRTPMESNLESRSGLAGARSEPATHQIGKLVPGSPCRPRHIAILLRESELPDTAVLEPNIRLAVG